MQAAPYVVKQAGGRWCIQSNGRVSDRFDDVEDAVLTAVIRAARAERQGLHADVVVEEHGRRRAVWGAHPAVPVSGPTSRRPRQH